MRQTTDRDVACIAALEAIVFTDTAWGPTAVEGTLRLRGSLGLLLFEDDVLIGYALGWMLAGEGELLRIAVHPNHRCRGIGRRVLSAFLDHPAAASSEQIFLEVRADNTPAQALYTRLGFVVVGTRPRYYRDGTDAILYTLTRRPAC